MQRNCSTPETFEKRSRVYQDYLINRVYNPRKAQQQFNKVKSIPRENLLTSKIREKKNLFFLVTDFNPIISSHTHLIYNSPSLAKIFPKGSSFLLSEEPKTSRKFWQVLNVLITPPQKLHLNKAVLNARANVIFADIF